VSKELQELEARLLCDKLNRRAKLLATVQRGNLRSEWYGLIFLLLPCIYALVRQAFDNDEALALLMIVVMMTAIIPIYLATANTRLDALVKILQEDGMLQGAPPVAKLPDKQ